MVAPAVDAEEHIFTEGEKKKKKKKSAAEEPVHHEVDIQHDNQNVVKLPDHKLLYAENVFDNKLPTTLTLGNPLPDERIKEDGARDKILMTQSFKGEERKKAELVFNHVKSKEYVESIAKLITLLAQNKGSVNVHVHVAAEGDRDSDAKALEISSKLNEFLGVLHNSRKEA